MKETPSKQKITPETATGGRWQRLAEEVQRLKQANLYRTLRVLDSPQSKQVIWQGRQMLMLASNAYLDLCNDSRVKQAAAEAALKWGVGSGGARLTTGTTTLHIQLESRLAAFKQRQAAIVFNTGFAANSGVIPGLCDSAGMVIYSDELNHASIIDGCRQAVARTVVYRHNDMQDLEAKIQANGPAPGLIVSDAVFSMDGDIVNLPELLEVARRYDLLTMLDEAHATGVIGGTGHGVEEHFGLTGQVDILMGTLSKAIGVEGGYVCGSQLLIDFLRNKTRSYIFSTSLSPVTMAAALAGLEIIEQEPERVAQLQANVAYFCNSLQQKGISTQSETAIIPIMVGDEAKALQVAENLLAQGYFITAIRYPTVPRGKAILRAALMSSHTQPELEAAATAIARALRQ